MSFPPPGQRGLDSHFAFLRGLRSPLSFPRDSGVQHGAHHGSTEPEAPRQQRRMSDVAQRDTASVTAAQPQTAKRGITDQGRPKQPPRARARSCPAPTATTPTTLQQPPQPPPQQHHHTHAPTAPQVVPPQPAPAQAPTRRPQPPLEPTHPPIHPETEHHHTPAEPPPPLLPRKPAPGSTHAARSGPPWQDQRRRPLAVE